MRSENATVAPRVGHAGRRHGPLASACGRRRAEKMRRHAGTQRPAGSALSWGGGWKGATPDCDRIAGAKWSREVTVTLSAPLRIAEGTCTAARSAALANFACGDHGASANGREFASWRTVVSGYPHQLDRPESIARVAEQPFVSQCVELEVTMKLPADRDFFGNQQQASANLPPNAP